MVGHSAPQGLRRAAVAVLACYWIALVVGTHLPQPPHMLHLESSDKALHFSAYFGLAVLLTVNWWLRRPLSFAACLLGVAIASGFGVLDEITQPPFNRTASVYDWLADLSGAALGVLAFVGGLALVRRWRERRGTGP